MPARLKYSDKQIARGLAAYDAAVKAKSKHPLADASKKVGAFPATISNWIKTRASGRKPIRSLTKQQLLDGLVVLIKEHGPGLPFWRYRKLEKQNGLYMTYWKGWNDFKLDAMAKAGFDANRMTRGTSNSIKQNDALVLKKLTVGLKRGATLEELAQEASTSQGFVLDLILDLRKKGSVIDEMGGRYAFGKSLAPAFTGGAQFKYVSRKDNTFVFGALGDSHLGSKYERLDVTNDLYDRYVKRGVDRVFHTGNWIDGDEPKNRHDISVHGLEPQLKYLAENYPKRNGLTTYAVTGEDHEGWWTRSEGIDIGVRAEDTMRKHGRKDWVNLGFMESHVRLVNANSGKESVMAVVHPGGGSAYALSYSIQKIIEALEGGEKPAVGLYGHYHKLWSGNIRNVWVVCTGCGQDQTIFTRNKIKQETHVGGTVVELEQDPRTGAIIAMKCQLIRYFVKGYYNDRWSRATEAVLPYRAAA